MQQHFSVFCNRLMLYCTMHHLSPPQETEIVFVR